MTEDVTRRSLFILGALYLIGAIIGFIGASLILYFIEASDGGINWNDINQVGPFFFRFYHGLFLSVCGAFLWWYSLEDGKK